MFDKETIKLSTKNRPNSKGGYVRLSKGTTHYQYCRPENAAADYSIVMLHGTFGPMDVWDRSFEFLVRKNYKTLRYDLFGRGFSDRPFIKYGLDDYLLQIDELLERLQINDDLVMVGHSLGCIIGSEYTLRNQGRVKALVLISPSGFPAKTKWLGRLIKSPFIGNWYMKLFGDAYLSRRLERYYVQPQHYPEIRNAYHVQASYKGFKRAFRSTLRNTPVKRYASAYQRLEKTSIPKLLLWGGEDHIIPFKKSSLALKYMPSIEFYPIENAGHVPQIEQAGMVNDIMASFLESLGTTHKLGANSVTKKIEGSE